MMARSSLNLEICARNTNLRRLEANAVRVEVKKILVSLFNGKSLHSKLNTVTLVIPFTAVMIELMISFKL